MVPVRCCKWEEKDGEEEKREREIKADGEVQVERMKMARIIKSSELVGSGDGRDRKARKIRDELARQRPIMN
jgi:hypothetical protein